MAADENGPIPSESLTTVEAMNDWLFRRQSRFNLFGRKSVFKAQVLTPPKALAVEGASIENAEHVCMIRFTSPHMPHKKFLPDPCELSSAENPAYVTRLVSLHTRMVIPSQHDGPMPIVNDIVDVVLEPAGFANAPYDIQTAKFSKLRDRPTPENANLETGCAPIASLFEGGANISIVGGVLLDYDGPVVLGGSGGEGKVASASGVEYWRFEKSFSVIDAAVRPDFEAFFEELKSMGYTPKITSTRRSVKHQWMLKVGILSGITPASPCNSDHQYGFAIDMNAGTPTGGNVNSKSSSSAWAPIVTVAARHNLKWQGMKDRVHFSHTMSAKVLTKLKQKCKDYYWTKYGTTWSNWPRNFPDELQYIDPPVDGVPMMGDEAAIAAAAGTVLPSESDSETDPQDNESGANTITAMNLHGIENF